MPAALFVTIAAISGFLAVALGAFGAHGLKAHLSATMMDVYQTAVLYQFIHTLALFATAILMLHWSQAKLLKITAWAFTVGLIVFSGSLYLLVFTGIKLFGALTPLGGVSFLIGWACLLIVAQQSTKE